MKQDVIDKLLLLANNAFLSQEAPDMFARVAAHEAAHAAACRYSGECADSAALIAAHEFATMLSDAAAFSSRITDATNDRTAQEYCCRATRESYDDAFIVPHRRTHTEYSRVLQPSNAITHMTNTAIRSSYVSIFANDHEANRKARHAANYVYRHTYCVTRSSYVFACFEANKYRDPAERQQIFQSRFTKRLNIDLQYDQIKASLFLQLMCSISLQVMAGIILLAGILIVGVGMVGIASLPLIETVVIGAMIAVVGAGLLIGNVVAKHELAKIDEANERMDEFNLIY